MKGTKFLSMEQMWRDGMKDDQGNIPKRMLDDDEEEKFWNQLISKKSKVQPVDEYSKIIAKEILTYIKTTDSVLEIGPGWGNYTYSLAEKAENLTCVEPSESCIRFLQEVSSQNDQVISLVQKKWEAYESEQKFDVIVGVNCFYRMYEIKKALVNMNQLARRRAIIVMTTAPMRPHYLDLEKRYGYKLKYPKRDYLHLLHLLYELGIYANCKIIPLTKTYTFQSYDELIAKNSIKLLSNEIDSKIIEQSLRPYIDEQNGRFYYKHSFYGALIDWEPKKLNVY